MHLEPAALRELLRKITETLARELGEPSAAAPDWSELDWSVARAVAAMHGVSPLLARGLRWTGPLAWERFLEQQRTHTAVRHARIQALLQRLDERTRSAGIPATPLKGVALHALGLYAPGDRPMADIDLLVRPQDAGRTSHVLESLGYRATLKTWKEQVFVPAEHHAAGRLGEHADNDIKIELHERICEMLPLTLTDISDRVFPVQPHPGTNGYSTPAALMMHLLLHAAGAIAFQSLRLLHLHDIALLAARMGPADWNEMLGGSTEHRSLWWAWPPLRLSSVYFPTAIPAGVLSALERECSWPLSRISRGKTLSDVSYSYPWVDAFPGIEWSRSLSEVAVYIRSRVRPSAEHLTFRETTATTQVWASANDWQGMPQWRRIVRWIASRPVRPVTLYSVGVAMAKSQ